MRENQRIALATLLIGVPSLLSAITGFSQTEKVSNQDSTGAQRSGSGQIRVHVNEVIVPVTITDKNGNLVLDLSQRDFQIFDGGEKQTIDHWELGSQSLAIALVIETSSHIRMMAPTIHRIGAIFTEAVMAANGEAAVITFDSEVALRQAFTDDHNAIEKAIASTTFETDESHLYDGMAKAVEVLRASARDSRRIMLVVGESQDIGSQAKLGRVLQDAELADITIYAIGPSSTTADLRYGHGGLEQIKPSASAPPVSIEPPGKGPRGEPYFDYLTPAIWLLTRGTNEIGNHQLEIAAAATGGIHYRALKDSTILAALDKIASELHAEYLLSYAPTSDRPAGFNPIRVDVGRANLKIRTRPGYYLRAPQ